MPTNGSHNKGSHNKGSHNKGSHNTVWPQPLKMSNKIVISIVACWLEQSSHALISSFRDSIRTWSRQTYPCDWQKYTSILQSERFSFNTNRMHQNPATGVDEKSCERLQHHRTHIQRFYQLCSWCHQQPRHEHAPWRSLHCQKLGSPRSLDGKIIQEIRLAPMFR